MPSHTCDLYIDMMGTLPHKAFWTTRYPAGVNYVQGTQITGANGQANSRCYRRTQSGTISKMLG